MTKIAVSYRRNDTRWLTPRICEHLENRFGAGNIFLDIDRIPIGADFRRHIIQTMESCDILVAVVGPRWLERDDSGDLENEADWVRLEISTALKRDIPVVPLLIDGTKMPKASQLPEEIRDFAYKQAGTFNSEDFRGQMARFVGLLDRLVQTDPKLEPIGGHLTGLVEAPTNPLPEPPTDSNDTVLEEQPPQEQSELPLHWKAALLEENAQSEEVASAPDELPLRSIFGIMGGIALIASALVAPHTGEHAGFLNGILIAGVCLVSLSVVFWIRGRKSQR